MRGQYSAGKGRGAGRPRRGAPAATSDRSRRVPPAGILIVEDEPDLRELVAAQLEALGYRVLTAPTGAAGLAVLRADRDIDLVFTDLVMPGPVDGLRLAEEARRLRPDLKIVFTSGHAGHAAMRRRRPGPGEIFLPKPYRREALAAAIARALSE